MNPMPFPERQEAGRRRGAPAVAAVLLAPAAALLATLTVPSRDAAIIATALAGLAALRTLATRPAGGPAEIDDLREVEAQLARWRRRGEPAAIIVLEPSTGESARTLAGSLRATDASALLLGVGGTRVVAALDGHSLDRAGVERRLAGLAADGLRMGWAEFPADGTTLEALVASASATLDSRPRAVRGHLAEPRRTSALLDSRSPGPGLAGG